MAPRELTLRERRAIEDMLNAEIPVREIATEIGRHVSTVYRDIKHNGYTDEDLPELKDTTAWLLNAQQPEDARGVAYWCGLRACAKP